MKIHCIYVYTKCIVSKTRSKVNSLQMFPSEELPVCTCCYRAMPLVGSYLINRHYRFHDLLLCINGVSRYLIIMKSKMP